MSLPQTVSQLYPDPWLRVDDLNGRTVTLTIARATIETVRSTITNSDEQVCILDFGRSKRLILNKTQCLAVADIAGTEVFADWPGVRIELRPGRARNGKPTIVITPPPHRAPDAAAEEEE